MPTTTIKHILLNKTSMKIECLVISLFHVHYFHSAIRQVLHNEHCVKVLTSPLFIEDEIFEKS